MTVYIVYSFILSFTRWRQFSFRFYCIVFNSMCSIELRNLWILNNKISVQVSINLNKVRRSEVYIVKTGSGVATGGWVGPDRTPLTLRPVLRLAQTRIIYIYILRTSVSSEAKYMWSGVVVLGKTLYSSVVVLSVTLNSCGAIEEMILWVLMQFAPLHSWFSFLVVPDLLCS